MSYTPHAKKYSPQALYNAGADPADNVDRLMSEYEVRGAWGSVGGAPEKALGLHPSEFRETPYFDWYHDRPSHRL